MNKRDKEVLNMQLTLIPLLAKAWNKSYSELSDIFKKYDVPGYIDVCYENYNSTGNQGIIDDLKDYIEMHDHSCNIRTTFLNYPDIILALSGQDS